MAVQCTCVEDAYVSMYADEGYNTAELKTEDNADTKKTLLGFEIPPEVDITNIYRLRLELYVKDYGGLDTGWHDEVYREALPPFNETTVDWIWYFNNNIPIGWYSAKFPEIKNTYHPIMYWFGTPLDTLQENMVDRKIYFAFGASNAYATFSSKESAYPPKLFVEFAPKSQFVGDIDIPASLPPQSAGDKPLICNFISWQNTGDVSAGCYMQIYEYDPISKTDIRRLYSSYAEFGSKTETNIFATSGLSRDYPAESTLSLCFKTWAEDYEDEPSCNGATANMLVIKDYIIRP